MASGTAAPPSTSTVVWGPIVGESIFRFDASEAARRAASPSLSFADAGARERFLDTTTSATSTTPALFPVWSSSSSSGNNGGTSSSASAVVVELAVPAGTSFYGTGEVSGPLERSGRRVVTWNTDAWGYGGGTASLYQSHPWVVALFPTGESFGALADTTLKCEVDLRAPGVIRFKVAAPAPAPAKAGADSSNFFPVVTFGPFAHPQQLSAALARAVGAPAMPAKWTLGFHQCRWSYDTAQRVSDVARTFRAKRIPCDVLWMDIDYMRGFRCFTLDPAAFPDPRGLAAELAAQGFRGVWMLDPGIKRELEAGAYATYESGTAQDVWVLSAPADGAEEEQAYVGNCWPGACVFPDYTRRETRAWWAQCVRRFCEDMKGPGGGGVDGIWNDMNEPAVFDTVTKTMPLTNIHRGDPELGGRRSHAFYHNVYGSLMARATFEGMRMADPHRRPFVLTRAGFVGCHRHAATWTGDNVSTWEHLRMSIPMALNLGLSGQAVSGPDIGGFSGDATPELFARWIGLGALLPFCRVHTEKGTVDQEPWSFGPACEDVSRAALERRYRLIPYLYTLMYQAHTTGVPPMRPLFWADPADPALRGVDDAFLLGDSLLVSADTEEEDDHHASSLAHKKKSKQMPLMAGLLDDHPVLLPNWRWFDFDGDQRPDLPLLRLRGGGIVPTGPVLQCVDQARPSDPVVLLVALDGNGEAAGSLFEDAGDGYGYTHGDYLLTDYRASAASDGGDESVVVVVWVSRSQGNAPRPRRPLHVRLLVADGVFVDAQGVDGERVRVTVPPPDEVARLQEQARARLQQQASAAPPVVVGDDGDDGGGPVHQDQLEQLEQVLEKHKHGGFKESAELVSLAAGDWALTVVPAIGGRITSILHVPSGHEWLWSRLEFGGYEEYAGTEYRSAGCTEPYKIVHDNSSSIAGGSEAAAAAAAAVSMAGDIGGGLTLTRRIHLQPQSASTCIAICSRIVATAVGAGSGGFSRLVCLRVHPTFNLLDPESAAVVFTAVDGTRREIRPGSSSATDVTLEGPDRPDGQWFLVDKESGVAIANRFRLADVASCLVHWGPGSCNLELWSQERPVSERTPIEISHDYRFVNVKNNLGLEEEQSEVCGGAGGEEPQVFIRYFEPVNDITVVA